MKKSQQQGSRTRAFRDRRRAKSFLHKLFRAILAWRVRRREGSEAAARGVIRRAVASAKRLRETPVGFKGSKADYDAVCSMTNWQNTMWMRAGMRADQAQEYAATQRSWR